MLKAFDKPVHSWREIAAEAKKETDPKKLIELVETLCEALETIRLDLERSLDNPFVATAKRGWYPGKAHVLWVNLHYASPEGVKKNEFQKVL